MAPGTAVDGRCLLSPRCPSTPAALSICLPRGAPPRIHEFCLEALKNKKACAPNTVVPEALSRFQVCFEAIHRIQRHVDGFCSMS